MTTAIRNSLKLDTIERISTAPNARQLVEAALDAVKEVVTGDYYSAITRDPKTCATELFHAGERWLGPAHVLVQTFLRNYDQHPFVQNVFPRGQSAVYLRSDLLPDRQWQHTAFYNEVDRPLRIRDMAAIYQTTAAGQLLFLTVGRSGQFRAPELEPVRKLQRVLSTLSAFRTPAAPLPQPPLQARHPQAALAPLRSDGSRLTSAGQSRVFVEPNEILCITADGNCSTVLTADKRKTKVRQTMVGWLELLPTGTFLQTDRATLINLRHISQTDFGAHCATVHFAVPVPALSLGRNAAEKLKRALQANNYTVRAHRLSFGTTGGKAVGGLAWGKPQEADRDPDDLQLSGNRGLGPRALYASTPVCSLQDGSRAFEGRASATSDDLSALRDLR